MKTRNKQNVLEYDLEIITYFPCGHNTEKRAGKVAVGLSIKIIIYVGDNRFIITAVSTFVHQ